jgi:hypothetical protein
LKNLNLKVRSLEAHGGEPGVSRCFSLESKAKKLNKTNKQQQKVAKRLSVVLKRFLKSHKGLI